MSQDPRIKAIFNDALDVSPSKREAFVTEACGDDDDLRARVDSMLAAHGELGSFLVPPPPLEVHPDSILEPTIQPTQLQTSGSLTPGTLLGERYRIEALLGRGGMGEVWRAFDLKLRVDVALKAVRADVFASEQGRDILRREVRAARDVVSPNVCRIFDLETEDGREFVSMEYIDGRTLLSFLKERAPLDLREAGEMAAQLLAGLEAIHAAGLVHRDVKPENVMLTRAGRVVVMDFGLAKAGADEGGTVAGTPAYMAPEQSRGDALDQRADIFAVGVILAEMITSSSDLEQRKDLWRGLRENPARVPEGPWQPVLRKSVAWFPDDRYPTARALSRALDEVALRAEGSDDRTPYPGLAFFGESDAEFFFGREAEVEELGKKLQTLSLLAVIGPSGVGKSSFLRAGLLPVLPEGWSSVVCTPGSSPFTGLAHVIAPQVAGDAEAVQQLFHLEDAGVTANVIRKWRQKHQEVLVVVDQFEELFTLNRPDVQVAFTNMLSRMVIESDVHVLLSMRDDFLFRCNEFPALKPIFSELTPLGPLMGPSLRRALVQPALACGYRFEDEALVDQMVQEISEERGALPLMAFAAARLWERRERSTGTVRRQAYQEIGGVGGALAKHAEATLGRIGVDREPIVRELFRNLVTAQGTRAVREVPDLLTVFEDRAEAEGILTELIDARLLTSFEVPGTSGSTDGPGRRVEIIHESLLGAWPRLLRWQTQDADGAQLRDQLRQGAQLWRERDDSDDLLWTGTAFREFQVWREHYPGRLTEQEEEFGAAMVRHDERQRIQKRRLAIGGISALFTVLVVVGALWQQARLEARRAEARNVLSHAEDTLDRNPSMAFAYALASLELADDAEARLFALRTLNTAPICFRPPGSSTIPGVPPDAVVDFSPAGDHLVVGRFPSDVNVWARDGRALTPLPSSESFIAWAEFARESDVVLTYPFAGGDVRGVFEVRVFQMPEAKLLRSIPFPSRTRAYIAPDGKQIVTASESDDSHCVWRRWAIPVGSSEELGRLAGPVGAPGIPSALDRPLQRVARGQGDALYIYNLDRLESEPPRLVGKHLHPVTAVVFNATGARLASADESGQVRIWSLDEETAEPILTLGAPGADKIGLLEFSPDGTWLAGAVPGLGAAEGNVWLWDLSGPPAAEPLDLGIRNETTGGVFNVRFHPTQRWLASGSNGGVALWPLDRDYSRVFPEARTPQNDVAVDPNGKWVVACGNSITRYDLRGSRGFQATRNIAPIPTIEMAVDPRGEFLILGKTTGGAALLYLETEDVVELPGFEGSVWAVAMSPSGGKYAAGGGQNVAAERHIRVWNRETGEVQLLDLDDGSGVVADIQFVSENHLLEARAEGIWLWNLNTATYQKLSDKATWRLAVSPDQRRFVSVSWTKGGNILHGSITMHDLETPDVRQLPAFGENVCSVLYTPDESIVAGNVDGSILVGFPGEEPQLLVGHRSMVRGLDITPGGRIVSASDDKTVRLWPMPEGEPLHTLPYKELLDRLRSVTNLRMVKDETASTGYRLTVEPFTGWPTLADW